MKKIFKDTFITETKPLLSKEYTIQRNAPCQIIERLFLQQVRRSFDHLHKMKEMLKNKAAALGKLEGSLLRQERTRAGEALGKIRFAASLKTHLLGRVWNTVNIFYGHQLKVSLLKLALYHPPSAPVKPTAKKPPLARQPAPTPSPKQDSTIKAQDSRLPAL